MKVLIVGSNGQVGQELQRVVPFGIEVVALTRAALDITDGESLRRTVAAVQPGAILNAAAYTAVDRAEQEPQTAFAVNAEGPALLAKAAKDNGARLLHLSTDFVFDGRHSSPYCPADPTQPLGVYGASKLEGEHRVQAILGEEALILRTAWVYSASGNNFVKTMLRLLRERDTIGVVADQIGTPTWARDVAIAVWKALEVRLHGVHHWTNAGVASWYDFAQAIQEEGQQLGLLQQQAILHPITTTMYPTPASRPAYSVLDKTQTWQMLGYVANHWRVALRQMLRELETNG